MAREIDTASVSASMVTISAGKITWLMALSEKSGRVNGGRCAASAPTVLMWVTASAPPARWLMMSAATLPTTMAMIMYSLGISLRMP